jgi:hypothetical protein
MYEWVHSIILILMTTFEKFIEEGSPGQVKEKKIGSYLIGM